MQPLRLVMASANPHKVAEIEELLGRLLPGVTVVGRPESVPDVVEDADTLLGNARLKAVALCRATGQPAVSDDTGLFVEALDGRPGVHTARFAGPNPSYEDNVNHLLSELAAVGASSPKDRRASFVTVAMVVFPDGSELHAEGRVDGVIAPEAQGTNGFGYDPVFVPDETAPLSFASVANEVKQSISHRSRAVTDLATQLRMRT